jgi:glutamine cyclotransferase
VINEYSHNSSAFTQGLVYDNGSLFEGTGLYGYSTLQRVDLETGLSLQLHALPDQYFGEGITVFDDRIIQLTWLSKQGFVYDTHSFDLLQNFTYPTEGWGITHDGSNLIMSDGTATLYFLDPETFERVDQVEVRDVDPVFRLNELEYVQDAVYANIWREYRIAIIEPSSGQVTGWINLEGIQDSSTLGPEDVLNGIAYDAEEERLFVTGKRWPKLYEIELIPVE